jgi:uroporphyrinogen decarboxylase
MPTYLQHAVACERDWQENVKWRLEPTDPGRWEEFEARRGEIEAASAGGEPPFWVRQMLIGGYMYLRNMFGPEGILYAFYDMPELVREIMETWFNLMDYTLARVQAAYALDEIAMGEDICYKAGMLISPPLWREFLRPYYQELIRRARGRQGRPVYLMLDTDGNADEANPLYMEIGFDATSPVEVASGQDVVAMGERHPELVIFGGLDKRLLTEGADLSVLDRELERILPAMLRRGGYSPHTDHGVPPDVPLANYLHYREKILELDH